jgi:hypothetical protein
MEEVDRLDDISLEELADGMVAYIFEWPSRATFGSRLIYFPMIVSVAAELPESSPRYVVLSYNLVHKDGRTSSPLVLINWAPTCEIGLLTLHATALLDFQNTVRPTDVQ